MSQIVFNSAITELLALEPFVEGIDVTFVNLELKLVHNIPLRRLKWYTCFCTYDSNINCWIPVNKHEKVKVFINYETEYPESDRVEYDPKTQALVDYTMSPNNFYYCSRKDYPSLKSASDRLYIASGNGCVIERYTVPESIPVLRHPFCIEPSSMVRQRYEPLERQGMTVAERNEWIRTRVTKLDVLCDTLVVMNEPLKPNSGWYVGSIRQTADKLPTYTSQFKPGDIVLVAKLVSTKDAKSVSSTDMKLKKQSVYAAGDKPMSEDGRTLREGVKLSNGYYHDRWNEHKLEISSPLVSEWTDVKSGSISNTESTQNKPVANC